MECTAQETVAAVIDWILSASKFVFVGSVTEDGEFRVGGPDCDHSIRIKGGELKREMFMRELLRRKPLTRLEFEPTEFLGQRFEFARTLAVAPAA
jgi:hypothetical protein